MNGYTLDHRGWFSTDFFSLISNFNLEKPTSSESVLYRPFLFCDCQVFNRFFMNKIHPEKLFNSKWTAVTPVKKEKHFIVSEIEFDEDDQVVSCCIEAVMSKRSISIDWKDLKDDSHWLHGWK